MLKHLRCIISPSRHAVQLTLGVVFVLAFGACSVGDFVGAYFNTYYNAQRQFTEAEDEMLTSLAARSQTEKTYLAPFLVQSTARAKFTSVIEKCSKLLQYHPESNLVDDALFMIGKSFYYQNENQQAQRKFKELLDGYPQSDLALETSLLYAYTFYRTNEKATAATTAKALVEKAEQAGEEGIVAKASVLLANCELENKNAAQAMTYFQAAADRAGTAEERATALLSVAEIAEKEGDFRKALEACLEAEDASTTYALEYRARLGQARMLSMLGKSDDAIALLDELLSNNNYREFFGEVNLEIGNAYREKKDYAAAIEQYRYVDTAYARSEASANSYYQLGLLYETVEGNYDSAAVAYGRGKTEFPQAAVTPQLLRRSDYLAKYLAHRNEIGRFDSIRAWILAPKETTVVAQDTLASDSTLAHGSGTADSLKPPPPPQPQAPPITLDSADARLAFLKTEVAALFFNTIEKFDSAEVWYRLLLVDHPASRYVPRAMFSLAQIYGQDSTRPPAYVDSIYREIIRRYPESDFAVESGRLLGLPQRLRTRDKAEAMYAQGEDLLQGGEVAAAIDTFRSVVTKYGDSRIASKAQYAIGWIYERVREAPDSAIANYQALVTLYPGSEYASLVRPKLSEVERFRNEKNKAAADTTKTGELKPPEGPKPGVVPEGEVDPGKEGLLKERPPKEEPSKEQEEPRPPR